MTVKTLSFDRQPYEAPLTESYLIKIEENILSGGISDIDGDNVENDSDSWGD